jgi:hypothetical protein
MRHFAVRSVALFVSVVVAAAASARSMQSVEWKTSQGGNGHWYELSTDTVVGWDAARLAAIRRGGHLAALNSTAEAAFLHALAFARNVYGGYVGLRLQGSGWRWITDEPLVALGSYSLRVSGDGSCSNFIDLQAGAPYSPSLNDIGCDWWDGPYFIEWSADCNNDGIIDYGQILRGELLDLNETGVPDVCEPAMRVPQDWPTIQSAVDAAPASAIILVAPGTYSESVTLPSRNMVIAPQDPLFGFSWSAPAGQRAAILGGGSAVRHRIRGAKFVGDGPGSLERGGVLVTGASPLLEGCSFLNVRTARSEGSWGGAADVASGTPRFVECSWSGCRTAADGGAVVVRGGSPVFERCAFANNGPGQGGDLFAVGPSGTSVTLNSCDFSGSSGGGFGARIYNYGSGGGAVHVRMNACVFHDLDQTAISLIHGWDSVTADGVVFQSCVVRPVPGAYSVLMTQSRSRLTFTNGTVRRCEAQALFGADPTQGGNIRIEGTTFCGNSPQLPGWSAILVDAGGNTQSCGCEADLDGNGVVDTADISLLLLDYGPCAGCASDLDGGGEVDGGDVALVLINFGPCP